MTFHPCPVSHKADRLRAIRYLEKSLGAGERLVARWLHSAGLTPAEYASYLLATEKPVIPE